MNKLLTLITITLPVLFGYIPLGIVFGFLITHAGMDWYIAPLFSLIAYAGAMQFLAIPLLLSASSYIDLAIVTLLVNFRHLFYGISLLHFLPNQRVKRIFFMAAITDESYSLLTSAKGVNQHNALSIVLINYSYWAIGSLLGATLARGLPEINGLDFSLTALFAVLFIEQFRQNPSGKLVMMALLSCGVAALFFAANFLIVASLLALLLLYLDFYYQYRLAKQENLHE